MRMKIAACMMTLCLALLKEELVLLTDGLLFVITLKLHVFHWNRLSQLLDTFLSPTLAVGAFIQQEIPDKLGVLRQIRGEEKLGGRCSVFL